MFESITLFSHCWNRLIYTKTMLSSFLYSHKNCVLPPIQWILIDQASNDGTPEYLDGLKKNIRGFSLEVVHLDKNVKDVGNNVALERATGDLVIRIDNDCRMLTPQSLAILLDIYEALGEDAQNHILSPFVVGLCGTPGGVKRHDMMRLKVRSSRITKPADHTEAYGKIRFFSLGYVNHVGGIFRAVPRSVHNRIGGWEDFTGRMGEASYFSIKVASNPDIKIAYIENGIIVEHQESTPGQTARKRAGRWVIPAEDRY